MLAQAVLAGQTRGYKRHPQLDRFREHADPAAAIAVYLEHVACEAQGRGYRFDRSKLPSKRISETLTVSEGQLRFEWQHLSLKLRARDPARLGRFAETIAAVPHPIFTVVPGPIAAWERV